MRKSQIELPFVKDGMTVRDLKICADVLETVMGALDVYGEHNPEEFYLRVLQYRDMFKLDKEE